MIYIYTCCFVSIEYIMWILYILYVLWRTPFLFSSLRFMCLISCFCQLETKIKSALQKSTLVCRITLFYVMCGSPQPGTSYVTNISISISISYSLQLQHHHHHHYQRCCCKCLVISTTWPAILPIFSSPCIFLSTRSSSSSATAPPAAPTITLSKTYLLLLDSRHPTVMVWHYRN